MSTVASSVMLALLVSVLILAWLANREACHAAAAQRAVGRYHDACVAVERNVAFNPAAVNTARWIKAKGGGQNSPDIEHFRGLLNSRRRA